jgi:hypothetical protein
MKSRTGLVLILVMVLTGCADLGGMYNHRDEFAWQAMNVVDVIQTTQRDRDCSFEANPLIGKNPDNGTVVAVGVAFSLLHAYASNFIREEHPEWLNTWQWTTGLIKLAVIANNQSILNKGCN